jgi:hypothetical protein
MSNNEQESLFGVQRGTNIRHQEKNKEGSLLKRPKMPGYRVYHTYQMQEFFCGRINRFHKQPNMGRKERGEPNIIFYFKELRLI